MYSTLTALVVLWLGMSPAVLDGSAIKDAICRFVAESLKGSAEEAQTEFRGIPDTLVVSSPACHVEVEKDGVGQLRGSVMVAVNVVAEGRVERRVPVLVTVRRFGDVIVAARPLQRHSVLAAADLRIQRMETTQLHPGYCGDVRSITGQRTKRMFPEGSVLFAEMCEPIPLIHQGDLVKLVVRSRSVSLSTQATAKQDGARGSVIFVQRQGSHDRIKARVLESSIVEALAE